MDPIQGLDFATKKKREMIDSIRLSAEQEPLNNDDLNKLDEHLDLIDRTFKLDEAITYQELDSMRIPDDADQRFGLMPIT